MKQIPLRLTEEEVKRLDDLAAKVGEHMAWGKAGYRHDVVRLGLALIEKAEQSGVDMGALMRNEYIILPLIY